MGLEVGSAWAEEGFLTLLPPRKPRAGARGSGAARPGLLSLAAASVSPPYTAEWARGGGACGTPFRQCDHGKLVLFLSGSLWISGPSLPLAPGLSQPVGGLRVTSL